MDARSHSFPDNARKAMEDAMLQQALGKMKTGFIDRRAQAAARLPEFEALRDAARDIKIHTLENLDLYLEAFEKKVLECGGHVHWAPTAADANRIIAEICKAHDATHVAKSKSMISEEVALNDHLEQQGIEVIETDLGEYIIQIRGEHPSHIIAPAIHLSRQQVEEDFRDHHQDFPQDRVLETPQQLIGEARAVLRRKFQEAHVGITGANFLVAETGSVTVVTNEGNADLTQSLPPVHIVLASIEKVVPNLEDLATLIRVLARSATGQEMSAYTTLATGPKRGDDPDGPAEFHVVLLDNGRSAMLEGEFRDMLRCIRCGACMNHCPVYHAVGGHAYGWVYPGPMGSVLTPGLIGVDEAGHLPNASTFCGRCEEVCPVRIPLPKMMRHWREREFERNLNPAATRYGLGLWRFLATRPRLYRRVTAWQARLLARWAGKRGRLRKLPLAEGWTKYRDLPAPEGRTFHELWQERKGQGSGTGKKDAGR